MKHTYVDHPVHDRLRFAERRLDDLRNLNGGKIGGADPLVRQQLFQEFFFHLVGAVDFLIQAVNDDRKLGLDEGDVDVRSVEKALKAKNASDPIAPVLAELHPTTRHKPLPTDPYSQEGLHFRIMLYRNRVSHVRPQNVSITVNIGNPIADSANFFLDPRPPFIPKEQRTQSSRPIIEELESFLELVRGKCDFVLRQLGVTVH